MSVTFSPELVTTARCAVTLYNPETGNDDVLAMFDSYAEAQANYETVSAAHDADGVVVSTWITPEAVYPEAPEVHMCNGRAVEVMMALDLDIEDLCGGEDAETFYARTLIALAQDRDDAEVPGFRDGNMYYGGRREGYITERLTELLEVAEFARAKGLTVTWG